MTVDEQSTNELRPASQGPSWLIRDRGRRFLMAQEDVPEVTGAYVRRLKLDPLFSYLRENKMRLSPGVSRQYHDLVDRDPRETLTFDKYLGFFTKVAEDLRDPQLGVRVSRNEFSTKTTPLRELFLYADTLHSALLYLNKCTPAMQNTTRASLEVSDGKARMSYRVEDQTPEDCRQDVEFSLFILVGMMRMRLGAEWSPTEMHFAHAMTHDDRDAVEAMTGVRPVPEQSRNQIVFSASWLLNKCTRTDLPEDVLTFFQEHIEALCERKPFLSFREKVEQALARQVGHSALTLENVAGELCMSSRSVQRKLAAQETSFSSLVSKVRREEAIRRMRNPETRIDDLAVALDYSDSAAFSKAFKKWVGSSPSQYRKQFLV